MAVNRRRESKQGLQQPLYMCRFEEVRAADDVTDALVRIIDDHGQVIGDAQTLAGQYDIARERRSRRDDARLAIQACALLDERKPAEAPQLRAGGGQRQAPRIDFAPGQSGRRLLLRQRCACVGYCRLVGRPANVSGDLAAGLETPVKEAATFKLREGRPVAVKSLRLAADRRFPVDAQPCEILEYRRFEAGAAASLVDVFDAEQQAPAGCACRSMSREGGKGVARV